MYSINLTITNIFLHVDKKEKLSHASQRDLQGFYSLGNFVFEGEHEKRLPHPRKAAGAQITHSWHGEVVTKNNNTGLFRGPVIGMSTL